MPWMESAQQFHPPGLRRGQPWVNTFLEIEIPNECSHLRPYPLWERWPTILSADNTLIIKSLVSTLIQHNRCDDHLTASLFADVVADVQLVAGQRARTTLGFTTLQASKQQEYAGTARVNLLFSEWMPTALLIRGVGLTLQPGRSPTHMPHGRGLA